MASIDRYLEATQHHLGVEGERYGGGYQKYFEQSIGEADLPRQLIVDMTGLSRECQSVVLEWVAKQQDEATAREALSKLMQQISFDITAAELGALLHAPGKA